MQNDSDFCSNPVTGSLVKACHRLVKSPLGLDDMVVLTRIIGIQRNTQTKVRVSNGASR